MKWIVLAALIAAVPVIVEWLRTNPREAPWLSGLMGVLLFVYGPYNLSVAPYPWAMWPGYVKGIDVTVLDVVALGIVIGTRHRPFKMPFRWQMILYLIAVVIAIPQSPVPMASSFYVWQLIRVYIVFRAVALVSQDDRHWNAILAGLILGLSFHALTAGWAWGRGVTQSGGRLGHQNLLGMFTNMVLMPSLAMALAGIRLRWAMLGVFAAAIALTATASRASIALGAVGVGLTLLVSLVRRPSQRKFGMAFLALIALGVTAPLASYSLSNRFQGSSFSIYFDGDDVRNRMIQATEKMIADHPFGVGPNYFVVSANTEQYWLRAGIPQTRGNMAAHVHNSYLLVQAETGFIGLGAVLLILFSAITYPLYISFKYRRNIRGDILAGLSVGLITFVIQNRVEWGVVTETVQYMLAINFGLIAGLARNIKASASKEKADQKKALVSSREDSTIPGIGAS